MSSWLWVFGCSISLCLKFPAPHALIYISYNYKKRCSPSVAAVANLQFALALALVAAENSVLLRAFRRRCSQSWARSRRCWNFSRLLHWSHSHTFRTRIEARCTSQIDRRLSLLLVMSTMSTIEQCKRQRTNIKRNIVRIKTLVTTSAGEDNGLSSAELRCRLGILENYFTQAWQSNLRLGRWIPTTAVAENWRTVMSRPKSRDHQGSARWGTQQLETTTLIVFAGPSYPSYLAIVRRKIFRIKIFHHLVHTIYRSWSNCCTA